MTNTLEIDFADVQANAFVVKIDGDVLYFDNAQSFSEFIGDRTVYATCSSSVDFPEEYTSNPEVLAIAKMFQ